MAMAQTAFRTRPAFYRHSTAAARWSQRAEMPLFQAFLRPSSSKVTDGLCIKDATTIDLACGSGNFLTETYLSLRRLENEAIETIQNGQATFVFLNPIKVHISQFYGIEINDFTVTVAKTALWIAESQMMQKTEQITRQRLDFLPLKTYTNIIEGNALRVEWNDAISAEKLSYIMGNPPFIGGMMMNTDQKAEMINIFGDKIKGIGELDYVAAWYKKATAMMSTNSKIESAFISTNSITQGEQATILWQNLINDGIVINYAYRTFRWDSEASLKAHVHCVIIGFSFIERRIKQIFTETGKSMRVKHINAYLVDAPDVFVENRSTPLVMDAPAMSFGNMPRDGGGFILSEEETITLSRKEPLSKQWIHFS